MNKPMDRDTWQAGLLSVKGDASDHLVKEMQDKWLEAAAGGMNQWELLIAAVNIFVSLIATLRLNYPSMATAPIQWFLEGATMALYSSEQPKHVEVTEYIVKNHRRGGKGRPAGKTPGFSRRGND